MSVISLQNLRLRIWEEIRKPRQQQTVCNMCKEIWIAVSAVYMLLHGEGQNKYDFTAYTAPSIKKDRFPRWVHNTQVCVLFTFRQVFGIHCEINELINLSIVYTLTCAFWWLISPVEMYTLIKLWMDRQRALWCSQYLLRFIESQSFKEKCSIEWKMIHNQMVVPCHWSCQMV